MANVRFGNIDRTPETTGKSVWGWYTEPERVTEEKRRARAMAESLAAAHEGRNGKHRTSAQRVQRLHTATILRRLHEKI